MRQTLEAQEVLNAIKKWKPEERIFFKMELEKIARRSFFEIVNNIQNHNKRYSSREVMKDVNKAVKEVRKLKGEY